MTLDQLLMLTTVIDLGNVQAASQKLNKTQPAISKGLKQLENQLQVSILDRSQYRLKLTTAGKQIYSHAKRILAEADILQQVTQHIVNGNETEITLSFDGIFDVSQITPILAKVQQIFPKTHIILRQEFLTGAFDALVNEEVDIAISPIEPSLTGGHKFEHIFLKRHMLLNVASPKLLNRHANLNSVLQLKAEYLIMLQDSGSITQDFEFGVLDGQSKYYVNDFQTKKQLIIDDLGWGKLPEHNIEAELKNGNLIRIEPQGNDNHIAIDIYAVKNKHLGPVAHFIWQELQKLFQ